MMMNVDIRPKRKKTISLAMKKDMKLVTMIIEKVTNRI